MLRIYASRVSAKMIDLFSIRNGSNEVFVCPSVGQVGEPLVMKLPVLVFRAVIATYP